MPLERWKRAVVHLEGAADSVPAMQRMERIGELQKLLAAGKITWERFSEDVMRIERRSRNKRYQGTAVYLKYAQRRYLLTARHVLHDETATTGIGAPEPLAAQIAQASVYSTIFRVPSLDEVLEGAFKTDREVLMNLGAGSLKDRPVTFSEPKLDLAVVSLDRDLLGPRFADQLDSSGYQPIHLDDVADGPSTEGAEIFTVGYPSATAIYDKRELPPARAHWESSFFSLPTFAFGKVSMLHEGLDHFWCDISAYPGNSGGPIVEDDKLVGIVSGQAVIEGTRIPFGHVVKAENIKPLLEE